MSSGKNLVSGANSSRSLEVNRVQYSRKRIEVQFIHHHLPQFPAYKTLASILVFLLCLQEMPKKKQEMYRKLLADSEILIATSVRVGRQHNAVGQDFRGKDIHRELAG